MLRFRTIVDFGYFHLVAMQCKAEVSECAVNSGLLTSPESTGKTCFSRYIALPLLLFIVGYHVQIRGFVEHPLNQRGKKHV